DQQSYLESRDRQQNGTDYPPGTFPIRGVTEDLLGPQGFLDIYGDTYEDVQTAVFWGKSTLNRGVLADRGASQRLSLEVSLPGGDLEYYKLDYSAQMFKPLTRALTLRLHTRLGYADAYGDMDKLPFFEHFYAGGFGSVRGFERNTLGPKVSPRELAVTVPGAWDDINGDGLFHESEQSLSYVLCEDPTGLSAEAICDPGKILTRRENENPYYGRTRGAFGGNVLIQGGAEILFPLPFIKDQRMLQTTFFVDAGNVFDTNCGVKQANCYDVDLSHIVMSSG